MTKTLEEKSKDIAEEIRKKHGQLAEMAAVSTLGIYETSGSTVMKIATLQASMIAFAAVVLRHDREDKKKK